MQKRAIIDNMHKVIVETIDFKDTTNNGIQHRINILVIN